MRNMTTGRIDSKKSVASFLALLSFTAYMPVSCLPTFAVTINDNTLPDLNKAVNGSVSTSGTKMDVSVNGGKGTVGQFDWNTFNVGKDATVNWVFNANSQTALNRVLATGGMSYIYGKLTNSSGVSGCQNCVNTSKVILINPAGILLGNGSQVDLNSFTASTFDIRNAKNLSDLSENDLKTYAGTGGETGDLFSIAGYNKTVQFVSNNNMVNGDGYIKSDATGTRLASIEANGSKIYGNKTVAMVGNQININNGTEIKTKYSSENPNAANGMQNRSTVKIVTGDGVNFYYTSAGNAENSNVVITPKTNVVNGQSYGIEISDSDIRSGNVLIHNGVDASNSHASIANSTVYGKKLLGKSYTTSAGNSYDETETGVDGNVTITSKNTLTIKDSNIQSTNDGTLQEPTTQNMGYGNVKVTAKGDLSIKNTQLRSADSALNTDSSNITAGNITIKSEQGNVELVQDAPTDSELYTNTGIVAAGDLTIEAAKNVKVDGYNKVQAKGYGEAYKYAKNTDRTLTITGDNVNLNNTLVTAKNLNVNSNKEINVTGTDVVADNTKLFGTDTTIDKSLLSYNNLDFHNNDAKINNVTIKNNTTLRDKDSTTGLKISTNGNLTVDNDRLQSKSYSGTSAATNQKAVELESTKGNVTVNNSKILTTGGNFIASAKQGNINVTGNSNIYATSGKGELTAKGNITVSDSQVWAKDGDMNVTSTAGKLVATNSNIVAEGGDTTVQQHLSMDIDNDLKGSTIGTSNKLTLKSNGDITSNLGIQEGQQLVAGTGYINDYKNLISLQNDSQNTKLLFKDAIVDAGDNIKITDIGSANNIAFVAGKDIELASTVGMDLTNVSTKSGANNETKIAAAGKLTTDDYDILGGGKTTLKGGTVETKGDTAIDTNGNKLVVNADGAIDIAVTGVKDTDKGLEINSDINTSAGSEPLKGRTVKVESKDADGTLAISKIKADTLDIKAKTIVAAKADITTGMDNINGEGGLAESGVRMDNKGYIEVRQDGKFTLDSSTSYDGTGNVKYEDQNNYGGKVVSSNTSHNRYTDTDTEESIEYGSRLVSSEIVTTDNVVGTPQVVKSESSEPVETPIFDDDGNQIGTRTTVTTVDTIETAYETQKVDTYQNTKTTTTTTTTTNYDDWETTTVTREGQHVATISGSDGQGQNQGFVLVYGKTKTETTNGTDNLGSSTTVGTPVTVDIEGQTTKIDTTYDGTTAENVVKKQTTKTTVKDTDCLDEDDLNIDLGGMDVASYARIPRHIEGYSNAAPMRNDLAETTSTVVAAAARLELADVDTDSANEESAEDDDSFFIE